MGFRYGTRSLGGPDRTGVALDMHKSHVGDGQFLSSYSSTISRGQNATKSVLRFSGLKAVAGPLSPAMSMATEVATPFAAQGSMSKSASSPALRTGRGGAPATPDRTLERPIGHQTLLGHHPRDARRALLETLADPAVNEIAEEIFKAYDSNNNGQLEADELIKCLSTLHKKLGIPKPDDATVDSLFKRFDLDGGRALVFKEFFELFIAQLRRSAFDRSNLFGREFFVTKNENRPWDVFDRIKELGTGSFGSAYLCKHKLSREEYVVKAVKKSRAKMPVEDIEKEILVMRQVDHPHVVRLFEWFEDTSRIYLVLEALKGGTLKDVVMEFQRRRTGLKEAWTRSVTKQSMEAMAYVHNLRLIHKDLKDENIMLLQKDPNFENPFVVLIDLGVAEMFSLADPTGQECGGTPTTMAPEVWLGSFGPKCDVFSLGCVLFEMLAGQMPFMASTLKPIQWTRLHKKGPDWSLVKTSPASKDICRQMLTYTDIDRPSMRDCLKHDWFQVETRLLKTVKPEQFMPLQAFVHQAALKRSVLLEMASRLPMHKATHIVEVFEAFDTDRDGTLTADELKTAFASFGLKDDQLVSKVFRSLDVDNDGYLSFSEFAAGLLNVFQDLLSDRLYTLFKQFDEDDDGSLDRDEAKEYLANAALLLRDDPNSRSQEILRSLLKTGRAKITFEELKEALMNSESRKTIKNTN